MNDGLGGFVRRRRAELGVTQTAIADASGLTKSHLSSIEAGKIQFPNADIRRRLAKALGVSHLELLVAAGEITEDELRTADAVGVVETDPDDLREILTALVRQVHWREKPELAHSIITIVRGIIQDQENAKRRRAEASSGQSR